MDVKAIVRQYRQGKNFRTETLEPSGHTPAVTIFNFDERAMYRVDPKAKQVVEMQRPDVLATFAAWITRRPPVRQSGKTVNIYYETIDTGERRQQFGFTARHLLLRERHIAETGACSPFFEIESDGWYLTLPDAQQPLRSAYRLAGPVLCRDTVVTHGHAFFPGFPVQETVTMKSSNPAYSLSRSTEVLEFSTQPLDKSLFEIPEDFKVVDMSWSEHLESDWNQLEQAAASWF